MAGSGVARPLGVTILAILAFIGGILGILGSVLLLFVGGLAAAVSGALGGVVFLLGLVVLVLSVVELVLGYGFWTLRPWAWQLGYVLMAVEVVVNLLEVLAGGGAGLTSFIVTLVIAGILAYYLNTAEVRRAFAAPEHGFPVVGDALNSYLPGGKG